MKKAVIYLLCILGISPALFSQTDVEKANARQTVWFFDAAESVSRESLKISCVTRSGNILYQNFVLDSLEYCSCEYTHKNQEVSQMYFFQNEDASWRAIYYTPNHRLSLTGTLIPGHTEERVDSIWKTNPDPPYQSSLYVEHYIVQYFMRRGDWFSFVRFPYEEPEIIRYQPLEKPKKK